MIPHPERGRSQQVKSFMNIKVKFFASLKESLGIPDTEVNDSTVKNVTDAWSKATGDKPVPDNLLCAVNHQHVELDHSVQDGDEIAFFPPVTGG